LIDGWIGVLIDGVVGMIFRTYYYYYYYCCCVFIIMYY